MSLLEPRDPERHTEELPPALPWHGDMAVQVLAALLVVSLCSLLYLVWRCW